MLRMQGISITVRMTSATRDCNSRPHGISHRSDRVVGLEVRLEVRWERQTIEKYIVITVYRAQPNIRLTCEQ